MTTLNAFEAMGGKAIGPTAASLSIDGDGIGNVCDPDADNDAVLDKGDPIRVSVHNYRAGNYTATGKVPFEDLRSR